LRKKEARTALSGKLVIDCFRVVTGVENDDRRSGEDVC